MHKILPHSLLILLALIGFADGAAAKTYFSVYGNGGVYEFSGVQNIEPKALASIKLALDIEGGKKDYDLSLEATYGLISANNEFDDETVNSSVARLDVLYPLRQKGSLRPFLSVGIGRMFFDGNENKPNDEDLVAYGGGLKYLITDCITLRAEGRHQLLFNRQAGNVDNYEYTGGVGYTFGKCKPKKKEPKVVEEVALEPIEEAPILDDDDLDGIKNPVDRCPGTPEGIKVDSNGCAEKTETAEEPLIEQLPAEFALPALPMIVAIPATVPTGSEISASADAAAPAAASSQISAALPLAQTIPALPLTQVGRGGTAPECSGLAPSAILGVGQSGQQLRDIPLQELEKSPVGEASFAFDKADLPDQAKQVIALLINQLDDSGLSFAIRVEGHTDSLGSDEYNDRLSIRRAETVARFLIDELGINPERVMTAGCGEKVPLVSNETEIGQQLNRRFELVILPLN